MDFDSVIALAERITNNELAADVLVAAVILIITAAIAHLVTKALRHFLSRDEVELPNSSIVVNIARGVVWIIGICTMLDTCFGVNVNAAIAALGVGGIALSLGFQDTLSNLIGGIQVTFMRLVAPGEYIEVGTESGIVQDVTWRHTRIRNLVGEEIVIPNSVISKTALVHKLNLCALAVPFSVTATDEPLDDIAARISETARVAAEQVCPVEGEVKVRFSEITEYGFKGKVLMTVSEYEQVPAVTDAVVRAIAPETR